MQDALFDDPDTPPAPVATAGAVRKSAGAPKVLPAPVDPAKQTLAAALPPQLRLGTSSWYFPGWAGLVWDGEYAQPTLSKQGLAAYAQHPLLRSVSLDRTFYRPLSASQFAAHAAQVPDDFGFVVKAPSLVADAMVRAENGRGEQPNPVFLVPALAAQQFV